MPQVCRQSDINSAGGSAASNLANSVITNNLPTAIVGTMLTPDALCPEPGGAHCGPIIVVGSGTVIVEGQNMAYVGSANNCGHSMVTGSDNVEVGM